MDSKRRSSRFVALFRLAGLGIAVVGVLMLAQAVSGPPTAYGDGAGSPAACLDTTANVVGSIAPVNGNLATFDAGAGNIVTGVCIKSGTPHSGPLGNGTIGAPFSANCYTVSGVGTQNVTVTRIGSGSDCQEISHIDVVVGQAPTTGSLTLNKVANGQPQSGVQLQVTGPSPATTTFSCTTNGSGSCTIQSLAPGSYDVSEPTPPQGFTLVGCTPDPVTVTVQGPNSVTCTNQPVVQTASLTLNKLANGQPQSGVQLQVTGPSPATTTFSCTTNGSGSCTIQNLTPGTYDVSEPTPPQGFTLVGCTPDPVTVTVQGPNSVTCTNQAITGPNLTLDKTGPASAIEGTSGHSYSIVVGNNGNAPTSGSVTVSDTLPNGLTGVTIGGTGWTCNPTAIAGPTAASSFSCSRADALPAGSSYPAITVGFTAPDGACGSITNVASVSGGGDTGTDPDAQDSVLTDLVCGSITIIKDTNPETSGPSFDFDGTLGDFDLADDDTITFSNLPSGNYAITENEPDDWDLEAIVCNAAAFGVSLGAETVTIALQPGENVTCTFVNEPTGTIVVLPTPTPPPEQPPVVIVVSPPPIAETLSAPPPPAPPAPAPPAPAPALISEVQTFTPPSAGDAGLLDQASRPSAFLPLGIVAGGLAVLAATLLPRRRVTASVARASAVQAGSAGSRPQAAPKLALLLVGASVLVLAALRMLRRRA
jgi:hypothetical protein